MRSMFLNSTALCRSTQIGLRFGRLPLREFEPGAWAWQWDQFGRQWPVDRVVTTVVAADIVVATRAGSEWHVIEGDAPLPESVQRDMGFDPSKGFMYHHKDGTVTREWGHTDRGDVVRVVVSPPPHGEMA